MLNAAALVIIVVGIGSFVGGRKRAGAAQMILWGVAVLVIQVIAFGFSATDTAWMLGPLALWAAAYVWSIVTGVQILART